MSIIIMTIKRGERIRMKRREHATNYNGIRYRLMSLMMCIVLLIGVLPLSSSVHMAAATAQPTVTVTHPEINTMKLEWKAITGVDGYNIYMKTKSSASYRYIASVTTTSFSTIGLNKDTTYYYKVIPYMVKNGVMVEGTASKEIKEKANREGIDVSKWQYDIDWKKVAAAGVKFAMIRVGTALQPTTGHKNVLDTYFEQNIKGALENGIEVGVYYYSKAKTTAQAKSEANYVLSKIKGYNVTYPVAMDVEDSVQKAMTKAQNTKVIKAFCDVIKAAGYQTTVYTYKSFMENYLSYNDICDYTIWMAQYNSKLTFTKPVTMWQYTSSGKIDGITKNTVDLNYDYDETESMNGGMVYNVSSKKLYYYAKANETITTIAKKLDVTASELVSWNTKYTASTKLSAGTGLLVSKVSVSKVGGLSVSEVLFDQVALKWNKVTGADGYYVERATDADGDYTIIKDTTSTSYKDSSIVLNETYYYRIVAYRNSTSGLLLSTASSVVTATPGLSSIEDLTAKSAGYNAIQLEWSAIEKATAYQIYRAVGEGDFDLIQTTSDTSYKNSNLTTATTYKYKVVAVSETEDTTISSNDSNVVSAKPTLSKPTDVKITKTYHTATLTWKKVTGATHYRIYRATSKSGKYTRVATVGTNTTKYTNRGLITNTTYYYKIIPIRRVDTTIYTGTTSSIVSTKPTLSTPSIKSLSSGRTSVKLTWNKVSGASGYAVYRSTSKNGNYTRVGFTTKTTMTNTKLKSKKTYYYKIRAYRTIDGTKHYSSYSSVNYKKTTQ